MTAKTLKRKTPTQRDAVRDIFLNAKAGLTLSQVATKATKKSGKETTAKYVQTQLRNLQKPAGGDYELIQTPGARKGSADKFQLRAKPTTTNAVTTGNVQTSGPIPTPGAGPANPINYGKTATQSNTTPPAETGKPVAGARAAGSYVDSLKNGNS